MPDHRTLLTSITDTLRNAGFPLASQSNGTGGATVSSESHGATVSWEPGPRSTAVAPHSPATTTSARARGGSAVRSRHFQVTLRLAALLADAGHHTEHLGERVLVGNPGPR
ncbi:hypothetical protein ACIQ9P_21375 [Kitasatospora sp. NPDC094019]|uniref:hypothetical protein n=1 Tax=Kitasatospora sp. NPDC094019 TaxID=3364091 RepID=UPI003813CBC4